MTIESCESRRHMARLGKLADRLDHQGDLERNTGHHEVAKHGEGLKDDAAAIRWALRQIEPEREAVGQVFDYFKRM